MMKQIFGADFKFLTLLRATQIFAFEFSLDSILFSIETFRILDWKYPTQKKEWNENVSLITLLKSNFDISMINRQLQKPLFLNKEMEMEFGMIQSRTNFTKLNAKEFVNW